MPYLASINTENGLVAGLASLAATTRNLGDDRVRHEQLALQKRQQQSREEAQALQALKFEAETAALDAKREREAARQEAVRTAIGQSVQGLRAQAEAQLSPGEKMKRQIDHRLSRVRATAQKFIEAGDTRGAQAYVEQARGGLQRFVTTRAFQQELEEVSDLIQDGVIPPEIGQQLAEAVQEEMQKGGAPGKAAARIQAIRKANASQVVRAQAWAEADQEMAGILSTIRDPELKKALQLEATLSQSASKRQKQDPDSTLASFKRKALAAEPRKASAAGGVMALGPNQAPSMAELEEFTRTPEYEAYQARMKAERRSRPGSPGGSLEGDDTSNDFVQLPPKIRAQSVSALRELVNTPGVGVREIQAVLDQFNLDPSTIPPDLIRELVGVDALAEIFEVAP